MAQSGFTPIQLFRTSTAAAVPTAGNLAAGELAINLTDERLYFKNAAGVVKLLADSSGALGTVTSVAVSGGTTGLTTSGGPITTSGTITLAGTLGVANGGTGTATAFTAGSVVFAGASGVYSQDNANLFWDNTNDRLGIGTATPAAPLNVERPSYGVSALFMTADGTGNPRLAVYGSSSGTTIQNTWSAGASNLIFANGGAVGSGTEAMRIDSSGNVGIGTSSPADRLHVSATGTAYGSGYIVTRHMNAANEKGVFLGYDADENAGTVGGANFLTFQTYNAANAWGERMRIDREGNVGIGTSSPDVFGRFYTRSVGLNSSGTTMLQINGTTYGGIDLGFNGTRVATMLAETAGFYLQTVTAAPIVLGTNNTERMRIDASGNVGIGTSSPSGAYGKLTVAGGVRTVEDTSSKLEIGRFSAGAPNSYIKLGANSASLRFTNAADDTDLMTLTNAGNVGIGTSSPFAKLEVNGGIRTTTGSGGTLTLFETNATRANTFIAGADASGAYVDSSYSTGGSGALLFRTIGTERMRITDVGNVGIGTSSITGQSADNRVLQIYGAGTGNRAQLRLCNSNTGQGINDGSYLSVDSNSDLTILNNEAAATIFATNGSERMRITSTGVVEFPNSTFARPGTTGQYIIGAANGGFYQQDGANYYLVTTTGGSTSDATLKKDVQQLDGALQKICAVRGVTFKFIEQPLSTADCGTQIGVIAQEIEAQFPEIVVTHENGTKAVRYDRLVAPLIEAIKELTARVAQLEGN